MTTTTTIALPLSLPPLPYSESALEPLISGRTVGFHYGKHHRAYVENANKLIMRTEFADLPLERIVLATAGTPTARTSSTMRPRLGIMRFTGAVLSRRAVGNHPRPSRQKWKPRSAA